MSDLISYQLEDGIATLTLSNGKVNAISPDVIAAFNAALDQAEADRAIVIITGQPGILSGGYDLKVMTSGPQNAINLVAAGSTLARRMLSHPYPIIVACSGHAVAKERLFSLVFPGESDVQYEAVEVVAYRLRKKLAGTGLQLVTLRGLGYLIKAEAAA